MPDSLFAFLGGRLAGRFDRTDEESATFTYAEGRPDVPLSLSLPFEEEIDPEVAFAYLDNLLPEDDETRARLAATASVTTDTFSMLAVLGEDVAGAVSLSSSPDLPRRAEVPLLEASEDDIAYRIATLRRDPQAPPPAGVIQRWSLAGQQAKFSLARIGDRWFWATYEHPSTHIFKPAAARFADADLAEKACLDLALEAGIPASRSEVVEFRGQRAFAVERWDRADAIRLHAEDLTQALGQPPYEKYSVSAQDVMKLLEPHGQVWPFVRQLAFHTAVGNSDAHGKNYSVLLFTEGVVRLAPLYDSLPVFLWPKVDQRHAMDIGGSFLREETTEASWVTLAQRAQVDPGRLLDEVRPVFRHVGERLPDVLRETGLPASATDAAAEHVRRLPGMVGRQAAG